MPGWLRKCFWPPKSLEKLKHLEEAVLHLGSVVLQM